MAKTLEFSFEELPLVIDGGFEAGLVNGMAEITYSDPWSFVVTGLWLEGFKENTHTEEQKFVANLTDTVLPRFAKKMVLVEAGSWMDTTICGRLYEEWSGKVMDAIRESRDEPAIKSVHEFNEELALIDWHMSQAAE